MSEHIDLVSREGLQSRVRSAVTLIHVNLRHVEAAQPGDSKADKAACEILLLCWGLSRNSPLVETIRKTIENILDVLETRLRGQAILNGLIWKPSLVPMLSMGNALLNQLDRRNPDFDRIVTEAWDTQFFAKEERQPFQSLETAWSQSIFGVLSSSTLPVDSILLKKPFPIMMRPDDAYAYTHTIFYATNFGALKPSPPICNQDVWDVINSGIVWSLARFDFDLLAEFLLSAIFARQPCSPEFHVGLVALLSTWDENGFVPDREIRFAPNQSPPSAHELFYAIYHANLVAAFLANELDIRDEFSSKDWNSQRELLPIPSSPTCNDSADQYYSLGDADAIGSPLRSRRGAQAHLDLLLGSKVATKVCMDVPSSSVAYVYAQLLICHGISYQNIDYVLMGIDMSLAFHPISWTLVGAARWLAMTDRIFEKSRTTMVDMSLDEERTKIILKLIEKKGEYIGRPLLNSN